MTHHEVEQRAARRAAPESARIPSGAEHGQKQSGGLFFALRGVGPLARRGLQGRTMYPSDEGLQ